MQSEALNVLTATTSQYELTGKKGEDLQFTPLHSTSSYKEICSASQFLIIRTTDLPQLKI